MPQKLINTESEKKQAVMIAVGIIAITRLIGGDVPDPDGGGVGGYLNECSELADEYIKRFMEAEKDEK